MSRGPPGAGSDEPPRGDAGGPLRGGLFGGGSPALVTEYRYNGLGQRIAEGDGTDTEYLIYNDRWRLISRHDGASDYLEETLYHHAGLDGYGGASDVDSVVMRRTFLSTGTPQTEDERWYVLQNWRQDVAAIIDEAAVQRERVFYSPYGRVFGMVAGDTGGAGSAFDGDYDATDDTAIGSWSGYDAYVDIDLDGDVDSTDASFTTNVSMGWDVLSRDGSTIGYAGYVHDDYIVTVAHVRHRVLKTDLGRWVQRDPAGYVDGANLYEYAMSSPRTMVDPMGLASLPGFGTGCGGSIGFYACGGGTSPGDPWQDGFDKAVRCVQRGATKWTDCMMCCGHGASGPHDPRLEGCRAGCDRHADPDPIYTPEPPFVPECWRVSPKPPGSLCLDYEPCETYSGANARCFCLCMGSDPWSDFVRACLRCHYDNGEDPDAAHQDCYDEADRRYPGQRPMLKLAKCAATCWTYQARYCPRTTIPSVIRWWIWPFSDSGAVD